MRIQLNVFLSMLFQLIEKGFAVRDPQVEVARENEAIDSVENFDLFSNCGSSVIEGESADFLQDDLEDEETSQVRVLLFKSFPSIYFRKDIRSFL